MRFLKGAVVSAIVVFGALAPSASAAPITPFSVTDNTVHSSLTATFSASPQADAFLVSNAIHFAGLNNNVLIELNATNNDLTIAFSQPLSLLSLNFALLIPPPGHLSYVTYTGGLGGAVVGSGAALAVAPGAPHFAEGTLLVTGTPFDTIVLDSPDAGAFAIDYLLVITAAPVGIHVFAFERRLTAPEPFSLALFCAGLAGASVFRRRRKASAAL